MDRKTIKRIRLAKGLDQAEFAEVLGVSRQVVCYWETGVRSPSPKSIKKVLEYCEKNKIKI